jgi:hypothetical protein
MHTISRPWRLVIAGFLLSCIFSPLLPNLFAQGSLTPPGAPASTMKSLDQIEARTPVDAIHTPGDFSDEFIISQPGSYYLTTNLVGVNATYGIFIATNNVTLDLNGFSVLGTAGAYDGIRAQSGIYNIIIKNGTVSGWLNIGSNGIGIQSRNVLLEHLCVCGNMTGVYCRDNTLIRDCNVSSNYVVGIYVGGNNCTVLENLCDGNNATNGINNASISVNGSNNRIDGNHICGSGSTGSGIFVAVGTTNNIIVRNSIIGSGSRSVSTAGFQIVGPLITNAASGIITNSNPWANFSL